MLATRLLASAAGAVGLADFVFTVVTTGVDETFTLPIYDGGTYNFNADWGDSSNSDITAWDDADKVHTYASAGTHEITITGDITGWRFNNVGDKLKIYEIKSWGILNLGTLAYNFYGCANLTITATDALVSTGGSNFSSCFKGCTGLTSIPANLFDNNTAITSFLNCFRGCTGLTSIPANLFDNNTAITSFSNCFRDCSSITAIPSGLFDNNTAITSLSLCFDACSSIGDLPDNLILYNVAIDDCDYTFRNCSGIVSGDGTAFVDRAELHGVTVHNNCFTGAVNIPDYASIPADWGGGGA